MNADSPRSHSRRALVGALVLVALASIVVCLPMFKFFWFENHDMASYPIRAMEYMRGWRAGYVFPRWAPDLYGGYGSPIFNFYSPGLFVFAAGFMLFGAGATIGLKLAVILFTIAGGFGTLALVYGETRRFDAATLAALTFVAMPYRFTQIYTRGDLAEYAAIALVPVSLWAYRSLCRATGRNIARWAMAAAVLQCAVLLTHTITGLFFTEILVFLVGGWALQQWRAGDRARARTLCLSWIAANGLCSFYAIPAILERREVQIERMTGGMFETANNVVAPLALVSAASFNAFYYAGLPILLVLLLTPVVLFVRRANPLRGELLRFALLTLVMCLAMLTFAAPLWRIAPFGKFIQFPWRLLGFVAASGAITAGYAWASAFPAFDRRLMIPLAILCSCVMLEGLRTRPTVRPVNEDGIPATPEIIAKGIHSTVVSDEYVPMGAVRPYTRRSSFVEPASRAIHPGLALQRGIGYRVPVTVDAPGDLDVLCFWFPGWRVVTESGPAPAELIRTGLGLMRVHFSQPGAYKVSIVFGLTPLRWIATILTWLTLALFTLYLSKVHRWRSA